MSNVTTIENYGTGLSGKTAQRLADDYVAAWSLSDAEARREAIAELWTPDGVEFVEGVQFRGHEGLRDRLAHAYTEFVASGLFTITRADDVTEHGRVVAFTIQLIARTGELVGTVAWDARVLLVLADDGRIKEDYHVTVTNLL
jgi:SnoaL-like domain